MHLCLRALTLAGHPSRAKRAISPPNSSTYHLFPSTPRCRSALPEAAVRAGGLEALVSPGLQDVGVWPTGCRLSAVPETQVHTVAARDAADENTTTASNRRECMWRGGI